MQTGEDNIEISEKAKTWIVPLARLGYVSRGVVYAVIGIVATWGAFAAGKQSTGSSGALKTILQQPFGQILLGITTIGLLGYAIWQFIKAVKDADNKGTGAKGILVRITYAIVGFIYLGLAYSAVQMILFAGNINDENMKKEWTAWLMAKPFGQVIVAATGLGFILFGCFQFYKAYTTKFHEHLKTEEMSEKVEKFAVWVGRAGSTARGFVFGIIGIFLMQAAINYNPKQAAGLSGALRSLEQQPFGPFILGAVALGLIAFGFHMFVTAVYRRIDID